MQQTQKNEEKDQPIKIKEVYKFLLTHWKSIVKVGAGWCILIEISSFLYERIFFVEAGQQTLGYSLGGGCLSIVEYIITSVISILILRCLLEKRQWPGGYFTFLLGRLEAKYIGWQLLLSIIMVSVITVFGALFFFGFGFFAKYFSSDLSYQFFSVGGFVLIMLPVIWIFARCILIFPGLLDEKAFFFWKSFNASFKAMKGYVYRMFWVSGITFVPLWIGYAGLIMLQTFIIFMAPMGWGILLLCFIILGAAIFKLFILAALQYIIFRFYEVRKQEFLEKLERI